VPELRRELVLAVTDGDLEAEVTAANLALHEHFAADEPMRCLPISATVLPIEFWLDLYGCPVWKNVARAEEGMCFVLNESCTLIREGQL